MRGDWLLFLAHYWRAQEGAPLPPPQPVAPSPDNHTNRQHTRTSMLNLKKLERQNFMKTAAPDLTSMYKCVPSEMADWANERFSGFWSLYLPAATTVSYIFFFGIGGFLHVGPVSIRVPWSTVPCLAVLLLREAEGRPPQLEVPA